MLNNSGLAATNMRINPRFIHCPIFLPTKCVYNVCRKSVLNTLHSPFKRLLSTINFSNLTSIKDVFSTLSTVLTIRTTKLNILLFIINTKNIGVYL
jgi:hypothetical protein